MQTIAKNITSIFTFGIRQKVLLVLLIVLLAALTVSSWLAINKERKDTLNEINQRGDDISRFVAKSLSYSVVGYDYHAIQLLLDEITLSQDIAYAKVLSSKSNTMAESGNITVKNDNVVIVNRDIELDGETVGKLVMGLSTRHLIEKIESQKYTLLQREALIILLIAFGEFIALSYIIVRPVSIISSSLTNNVNEQGHIVGTIPITSNDEFGHLAESFNKISAQLNSANDRLQSKVDLADKQLIETNKQLVKQSEELEKINEEFRMRSITDELTGLYNRRHFEELLEAEIKLAHRHGHATSLLVIDIDFFKKINDTYGHPCGDTALQSVATGLQERLRSTDIVCRLGGEEFIALCKWADKTSAIKIAEELRQHIEDITIEYGEHKIKLTISIGAATDVPESEQKDMRSLYSKADAALYYSKQNGRNRVTHVEDMDSESICVLNQ